jgi:hypothetical protein
LNVANSICFGSHAHNSSRVKIYFVEEHQTEKLTFESAFQNEILLNFFSFVQFITQFPLKHIDPVEITPSNMIYLSNFESNNSFELDTTRNIPLLCE